VAEYRLFDPAAPPEWLDPEWWRDSESCDHLAHPAGVHTARLQAVAELADELCCVFELRSVVDVGAGDGALLSLLPDDTRRSATGFEIVTDSVRVAREVRGVDVRQANVLTDDIPWGTPSNVVVCTEVLEHQADPHGFVRDVLGRNADWLIASSPHSETPERHEWNHAWAWDRDGYRALIEQGGFEVVRHLDIEWSQVVLARKAG
jgi:hypothetical protein